MSEVTDPPPAGDPDEVQTCGPCECRHCGAQTYDDDPLAGALAAAESKLAAIRAAVADAQCPDVDPIRAILEG